MQARLWSRCRPQAHLLQQLSALLGHPAAFPNWGCTHNHWTSNTQCRHARRRPFQSAAHQGLATVAAVETAAASLKELDHISAPAVLKDLGCILFDCDGVLWTGSNSIPGAQEALKALRQQGKRVLFVTNNASKSRAGYVSKFKSFGLDVEPHEIISASYAAAAYLDSVDFKSSGKKVLLLGFTGVEQELNAAGIPWVGGTTWQPPVLSTTDDLAAITLDADIGAVVCSWDPAFSYTRLVYASACLRELPGCLFVTTNPDDADNIGAPLRQAVSGQPLPSGTVTPAAVQPPGDAGGVGTTRVVTRRMQPGTGCLMVALEAASGRKSVVVGKGGPWLVPFLLEHFNLEPSRTAIVGDRLDTDVALGKAGGLMTFLPLTGVTTRQDALAADAQSQPDYIIPSIAALAGLQSS